MRRCSPLRGWVVLLAIASAARSACAQYPSLLDHFDYPAGTTLDTTRSWHASAPIRIERDASGNGYVALQTSGSTATLCVEPRDAALSASGAPRDALWWNYERACRRFLRVSFSLSAEVTSFVS